MEKEIRKTLLHDWHVAQGANMASFGGYDMPLWYPRGAKKEHLAVLTHAGIFDTSHMAAILVTGAGAADILQQCFTKDLGACIGKSRTPLTPGRCVYGAYLNERGEVIDDAIVSQIEANLYMVVVNAGMGRVIADHMAAQKNHQDADITDMTDKLGKLDIQGPMSAKILAKVLENPEVVLCDMEYFTFRGFFDPGSPLSDTVRLSDGIPVLLSRTGYTGELGFEIFVHPDKFVALWEMLLDVGKDLGLTPCGLAARDSLRAGAMLPLSHQDIGAWPFVNHPWEFALPYTLDKSGFTKKFIGDNALRNTAESEHTLAFAGYDLRKIPVSDQAYVADASGNKIGRILTCVSDMGIGCHENRIYSIASPDKPENFTPKGLCCGFVRVGEKLPPGEIVELRDARRKIKVMIVDDIRPDRTARKKVSGVKC